MKVVAGQQAYSARANWKLLVENSYDGYHGLPTHQRYFTFLADIGIDLKGNGVASPARQKAVDLGNGHAVLEYQSAWGRPIAHWVAPFGEHRKPHFERIAAPLRRTLRSRARAAHLRDQPQPRDFSQSRDQRHHGDYVRTFYPISPDYMEVNAWALAPIEESAEDSALRLDNFLTFLGPGGFATPDDVEMLESCQRGFRQSRSGVVRHLARHEARTSVDHRRTSDARVLAPMEPVDDGAAASAARGRWHEYDEPPEPP